MCPGLGGVEVIHGGLVRPLTIDDTMEGRLTEAVVVVLPVVLVNTDRFGLVLVVWGALRREEGAELRMVLAIDCGLI